MAAFLWPRAGFAPPPLPEAATATTLPATAAASELGSLRAARGGKGSAAGASSDAAAPGTLELVVPASSAAFGDAAAGSDSDGGDRGGEEEEEEEEPRGAATPLVRAASTPRLAALSGAPSPKHSPRTGRGASGPASPRMDAADGGKGGARLPGAAKSKGRTAASLQGGGAADVAAAPAGTLTRAPPVPAPPPPAPALAPAPPSAGAHFVPGIATVRLSALPFRAQVLQPEFYLYVVFFTVCIVRFQFYIGTVGTQMDALGQAPDAPYSKLFGTILPLGFFSVFAIGALLDTRGVVAGMSSLTALACALSLLALVPSLPLQPLTFVVFAAFRGFLFCNMTVYLSTVFGYAHLGSLIGTLTTVGGLVGLTQSPLLLWAYDAADPATPERANFTPPNLLMLALTLAAWAWPVWLARRARAGPVWRVLCCCRGSAHAEAGAEAGVEREREREREREDQGQP
jgi:hypothetical protein